MKPNRYPVIFLLVCCLQIGHCFALLDEKIDIVYTWVDGADLEWQKTRDQCLEEHLAYLDNFDANSKNRYRNRDELKYSLRSVYQFADFINHIYIVTFGQRPSWLKPHPKITIIDHQEIFPNQDDLPTFNSQAIESNLHRIPNLSEKFIYLNDDVFFGTKLYPQDFFNDKGQILAYLSTHRVPMGPIISGESAYDSAWKNTNQLLNSYFKKERRYKLAHAPFALCKSLIEDAELHLPQIFRLVSSHRFRMPSDFIMTNGFIQYYGFYNRRTKLCKIEVPMVRIRSDLIHNEKSFARFKQGEHKFFCVQDLTIEDDLAVDAQLEKFFMLYFPDPAPWEYEYIHVVNEELATYPCPSPNLKN